MESEFWIRAWKEGRTAFNQTKFNAKLMKYFPEFHPQPGQSVFVPLCGKTKDMILLKNFGLQVFGIELYEEAVKEFFSENNLGTPLITQNGDFKNYALDNLVIRVGDLFKSRPDQTFDFVYDRASLVALPKEMRRKYAGIIKDSLKTGGQYLLITYEYDSSEMEGPPFSVEDKEVFDLFSDQFRIELQEAERPKTEGSRLSAVKSIQEKVFVLKKT